MLAVPQLAVMCYHQQVHVHFLESSLLLPISFSRPNHSHHSATTKPQPDEDKVIDPESTLSAPLIVSCGIRAEAVHMSQESPNR
jgi:hypothetical protein